MLKGNYMRFLIVIGFIFSANFAFATTVKEANQFLNEVRTEFAKYKTQGRFIQAVALQNGALIKKYDLYNAKINLKAPLPNLFVADNHAWLADSSGRTNFVKVLALNPLVLTMDGQLHIYHDKKNTNKKSSAMNWLGSQSAYARDPSLFGGAVLLGLSGLGGFGVDGAQYIPQYNGPRYNGRRYNDGFIERRRAVDSLTRSADWPRNADEGQAAIDLFAHFDKLNCTADSMQVGETDTLNLTSKVENGVAILEAVDKNSGQKLEIRSANIGGRKRETYLICSKENKCEESSKEAFHGMLEDPKLLALDRRVADRDALAEKFKKSLKTAVDIVKARNNKQNDYFECAPRPPSKLPLASIASVKDRYLKDQGLIDRAYERYQGIYKALTAGATATDKWLKYPWYAVSKPQFQRLLAARLFIEKPETDDLANDYINMAITEVEYYDLDKFRPFDVTNVPKGTTELDENYIVTPDEEQAYRVKCYREQEQSELDEINFVIEQFKTVATEIDGSTFETEERQSLLALARETLGLNYDSVNGNGCKEYKTEKSPITFIHPETTCFKNKSCFLARAQDGWHSHAEPLDPEAFNSCLTQLKSRTGEVFSSSLNRVLETVSSTATCCGSPVCKESFAKLQTLRRGLDKSSGKATQTQ